MVLGLIIGFLAGVALTLGLIALLPLYPPNW